MPLKGTRTHGAFGLLNRPLAQVGEDLRKAFDKARAEALNLAQPRTKGFPLDRLRRRFADTLGWSVVFQPKAVKVKTDLENVPKWEPSPVWRAAPRGAVWRSYRISSLLTTIAVSGWKANCTHDLVRLAINTWHMPKRHFCGIIRRILARVEPLSRLRLKSPDPVLRLAALSTNPMLTHRVYQFANWRGLVRGQLGVTHRPKDLGTTIWLLNAKWREARRAKSVLNTRT